MKFKKNYFLNLPTRVAERFSALDLCSDGRVVRMWVRIPAATVVLMSLSKTLYHNWFSPPGSKWVPVRAAIELYTPQGAEMVSGMIYAPDEHLGNNVISAVIPRVRAL